MPFMNSSAMDSRRRLVLDVNEEGLSLSEACRRAGVTRKTGLKWVRRAQDTALGELAELSRAPKSVSNRTPSSVEDKVLALKDRYPDWAGRKLSPLLETETGIVVPSRTVDRILQRHGRTRPAPVRQTEPIRFERTASGLLLQMDFKGLPKSVPYALLTVLDDHSRFCVNFSPVKDKTGLSVQTALWNLFGEHGLPESMLMDNGDCWGATQSSCPTRFEAWLMRLGIKPIHGRPMHPQTQGKVERFHLTAKTELAERLVQPCAKDVIPHCREFVKRYNWVRPHDALGGKVPASAYRVSERKRPDKMPEHIPAEGAVSRKVDANGFFHYQGQEIKIGKGLIGERIVIQEAELGPRVFYARFPLSYLSEL